MLTLLILFACLAFSAFFSACVAKLVYTVTQKGEIFGGWQNVLDKIHPKGKRSFFREFWYKRLGGCLTCMRQFIAEISFFVFVQMWHIYDALPTFYAGSHFIAWLLNVLIFIVYCAVALTLGQLVEYEKREAQMAEEFISQKAKPRSV